MAADAGTATADAWSPGVQEGRNPFVAEEHVIRVSKADNWQSLGQRVAAVSCGQGVALMRAVGKDSVYSAVRGLIHARSIAALRGLDLQCTMGYQEIRIGSSGDLVSAVVIYAFARRPDQMTWEEAP